MRQRIFTTVLAVALGVNLYLGARHLASSAEANGKDDVYANMEKFTRVLETVRREYVDEDKVSYEDLVQGALRGMIQTLADGLDKLTLGENGYDIKVTEE